ncbi:MAG TPA: WbqC family protein [Bacteroidales bacterium]|nr:WbqC family protein [Bacteroidales bacterium]
MHDKILLTTAYLPPISYFTLLSSSASVFIEKNENYVKQTYRNRCYILSPHGRQLLVVPVLEGSRHKIGITEVRIDYSKRWQQVHLRAMVSAYKNSPFFDYYFDDIENTISAGFEFLWELNNSLLKVVLDVLKIKMLPEFTAEFEKTGKSDYDYRYIINPEKPVNESLKYTQVFMNNGFVPDLSIIDLIFNMGPDSLLFIQK